MDVKKLLRILVCLCFQIFLFIQATQAVPLGRFHDIPKSPPPAPKGGPNHHP
ncbi:hypothetical protein AAHE18_19G251900 [Arachis hypogaea]|uniref:Transmembrane protein n=1 Tax=Arachis hypogaea TaxID=3818 RepID=A0A6B9VGI2_ARAHY|nr:uncharacterized protein DS421_19g672470 [Arachis hypogaea]